MRRALLTTLPIALAFAFLPPASAPIEAQTWASEDAGGIAAARSGFGSWVHAHQGEIFIGSPGWYPLFPILPSRPGLVAAFGPDNHSGMGFGQYQTLTPSEGTVGDGFGSVMVVDGDRMLVSAPTGADGAGLVYRFVRGADRQSWESAGEPIRATGVDGGGFGASVALAPDVALIGAPAHDEMAGAVILSGPGGRSVLQAEEPIPGERFGASMAVQGEWLAVGAPGPDLGALAGAFGGQPQFLPGAVYLFRMQNGSWVQTARVAEPELGPSILGASVVLSEDGDLFAGAPLAGGAKGEVRHFRMQEDGSWEKVGTLTTEIAAQGFLGQTLALDGDRLAAGAPLADVVGVWARNDAGDWEAEARLTPAAPGGFFGVSVALTGGSIWVGSPGSNLFSGEAHEYRMSGGEWALAESLDASEDGVAPITGEEIRCSPEGEAAGFTCADVDLLAFIPMDAVGADPGTLSNDVWGWTDPEDGREYVLMGTTDATVFVDVTEPGNPRVLGSLPLTEGARENLWRDMKVYANHTFIVADQADAHGMQVFDLTRLRGLEADPTRIFDADAHYDLMDSAHNVVINEDSGFAYIVGASSGGTTCGGGLHMVDVRDPKNPTFAGCFQDPATGNAGTGYSHDAQCINYRGPDPDYTDAEICFGANETALSIADVTDKANPRVVASATYPNSSYLHQGWVSEDHRYFFMNDEGDELSGTVPTTRTLVWDIEDLDDPILVTEHFGTTAASDHNLYIQGDLMYQANYVSGLRILDVSNPESPVEVGFFDTVPMGDDAPGFAGAFSVYPYFESGTLAVTSMREGLFLLKSRVRRTVF